MRTDVFVVGAGAAGLFAALHLPEGTEILVVDKGRTKTGSSPWAQGGIAAALGPEDSPELHASDTIRVASGHADEAAVRVLCSEAPECVMELVELGCAFDRNEDGTLHLAREGGQSVSRSAHTEDATGAAIMTTLRKHAKPKVDRIEGVCIKLDVVDGRCVGGWVLSDDGLIHVQANSTVLASGGVGALFPSTTNPPGATGDGLVLALEAGAGLADLEFVQFHPTSLALGDGPQHILVTEALRGAGAHVVDADGRRFLFDYHSDGELAPRDVVARAIEARKSWLDCRHLGLDLLEKEFPTVLAGCREHGVDPATEPIPVAPAAHYFIGGIQTDLDGRTTVPRLYAIGECSNTGVHGANRLAGNSLAEALVFGRRAARAIAGQRKGPIKMAEDNLELASVEIDVKDGWGRVRSACAEALGIERYPDRLRSLPDELEDLTLLDLVPDRDVLELRSAAIIARFMARSALLRTESRGGHRRVDFPEPDPNWAGIRLRITLG